jgi:hypothetical protein
MFLNKKIYYQLTDKRTTTANTSFYKTISTIFELYPSYQVRATTQVRIKAANR